jgi:hypothetical protein
MGDCLERTYFSQHKFVEFLDMLSSHKEFCGPDPKSFWETCNLLDIQSAGNSQREMVAALKARIKKNTGARCAGGSEIFVYLDDAIFSGGRAKTDLSAWIENSAPTKGELRIVTVGLHGYGQYVVEKEIRAAIRKSEKKLTWNFWSAVKFANHPQYPERSDVLWPSRIPNDNKVVAYYNSLPRPDAVKLRDARITKPTDIFPDVTQRELLEQILLRAGVRVRERCPNLKQFQRPLGNITFSSFGFGSMFVTFRNCANNVPIALWAGDPWIPLFPRKTNSDSAFERFVESL